jgi:hypothetical protein
MYEDMYDTGKKNSFENDLDIEYLEYFIPKTILVTESTKMQRYFVKTVL